MLEEFGVNARIREFVTESTYEYAWGSIRLMAYAVDILGGELTLSVHDQCRWVEPRCLDEYSLLPADIPIAKKLQESARNAP